MSARSYCSRGACLYATPWLPSERESEAALREHLAEAHGEGVAPLNLLPLPNPSPYTIGAFTATHALTTAPPKRKPATTATYAEIFRLIDAIRASGAEALADFLIGKMVEVAHAQEDGGDSGRPWHEMIDRLRLFQDEERTLSGQDRDDAT